MEAKRNTSKRYPPEVKERAVRLVLEARAEDPKDAAAIGRIARHLGVGAESLRQWVKQAGLPQVWLTSLLRGWSSRKGWNHAQEVPAGVQA
jgi:hypothetical protein